MIQIDMEMPVSCMACPIKQVKEEPRFELYYFCPLIKKSIRIKEKEAMANRLKDCPFKETNK